MDRHVDAIAMLIEDLDHLLIGLFALGVGDRHAHQPTELTHTMIDMHHKVANLELLDLLQRERHLTTTGLVALEVVFMETIEYLMVGKETDTQVVVSKTLVEGLINAYYLRGKRKEERDLFEAESTVGVFSFHFPLSSFHFSARISRIRSFCF